MRLSKQSEEASRFCDRLYHAAITGDKTRNQANGFSTTRSWPFVHFFNLLLICIDLSPFCSNPSCVSRSGNVPRKEQSHRNTEEGKTGTRIHMHAHFRCGCARVGSGSIWGSVTCRRVTFLGQKPQPWAQVGASPAGEEPWRSSRRKCRYLNPQTWNSPKSDKQLLIYRFCSGLSASIYCLFIAITSVFLIS